VFSSCKTFLRGHDVVAVRSNGAANNASNRIPLFYLEICFVTVHCCALLWAEGFIFCKIHDGLVTMTQQATALYRIMSAPHIVMGRRLHIL
jgi:hypothetical protein